MGRRLITHPTVDAVILTGAWDTAQLFLEWDPTRRLHAETSGKNALVITATADLDAAIADLVRSAFGHAGQKCSAASLALVEASVYDGPRFLPRLADAVRSLPVGPAADPASRRRPADRAADRARWTEPSANWTTARPGWWPPSPSPGRLTLGGPACARASGPDPGSTSPSASGPCSGSCGSPTSTRPSPCRTPCPTASRVGSTAWIRPRWPSWLDRVEVGNAYVNRPITGAVVGRQPFGGWKRSSVGPTAKAGGPNYVLTLGRWSARGPLSVEQARDSFAAAWADEFAVEHDRTGLAAEANVLRYRPLPAVLVRVGPSNGEEELAIVRLAAETCGVPVSVSTEAEEPDVALAERLAGAGVTKLRLLTPAPGEVWAAAHRAGIVVDDSPVVDHGRIELLRWVREQAVSRTRHRYGYLVPDPP